MLKFFYYQNYLLKLSLMIIRIINHDTVLLIIVNHTDFSYNNQLLSRLKLL